MHIERRLIFQANNLWWTFWKKLNLVKNAIFAFDEYLDSYILLECFEKIRSLIIEVWDWFKSGNKYFIYKGLQLRAAQMEQICECPDKKYNGFTKNLLIAKLTDNWTLKRITLKPAYQAQVTEFMFTFNSFMKSPDAPASSASDFS